MHFLPKNSCPEEDWSFSLKNAFFAEKLLPWKRRLIFSSKNAFLPKNFCPEEDVWYFRQKMHFCRKTFALKKTFDIFVENFVFRQKMHFLPKNFCPEEDVWYFRRKFGLMKNFSLLPFINWLINSIPIPRNCQWSGCLHGEYPGNGGPRDHRGQYQCYGPRHGAAGDRRHRLHPVWERGRKVRTPWDNRSPCGFVS